MKDVVQISKRAIELRRLGHSYKDISNELKISKTSVSNYVSKVRLTENEKLLLVKNLNSKIQKGRLTASISIRSQKVFKEKIAYEKAEKEFDKFIKDPLFMMGIGLCSTHGLKKLNNFQFVSPDSSIIKIMLLWMKKYINLSSGDLQYRLFIDSSFKNENCEQFWAKICGVSPESLGKTVYITSRKHAHSREYRGSLAIIVTKVHILRQVIAWQKLAIRYHS